MVLPQIFATNIFSIGVKSVKNILLPLFLLCLVALTGCSDGNGEAIRPETFAPAPASMPAAVKSNGMAPPAAKKRKSGPSNRTRTPEKLTSE